MTKRNKGAPASEKPENHSLILATAESLGRMIGALQRQLGAVNGSTGSGTRKKKKRPAQKPKTTRKTKKTKRG